MGAGGQISGGIVSMNDSHEEQNCADFLRMDAGSIRWSRFYGTSGPAEFFRSGFKG